MDYSALQQAVEAWLAALAMSDPSFEWAAEVTVEAYPAFLLPTSATADDGERVRLQSIATLPIKLKEPPAPDSAAVKGLHDWVVRDRTLSGRVGHAIFEDADDDPDTICILVVTPKGSEPNR